MSDARTENVISVEEVAGLLSNTEIVPAVILLDARQGAGEGPDREAYRKAHIPGALFADLDRDLAGASNGKNGKRPLPGAEDFQKSVRGWGIGPDSQIVIYGAARTGATARAWWLLKWAGLPSVRILDGGIEAWVAAGRPVSSAEEPLPAPGTFTIKPGQLRSVDVTEVPALAERGILLDARAAAKFSATSGDPGAGHIPGAVSAPASDAFDADGKLKSDSWLRERYREYGVAADGAETGAYCGTGGAAALEVFVLATLGIKSALYVGSWSEWTADPSRPVAR
jgi:thiosulfate/3-mercaptopyruvate sulfurtransferase